MTTPSVPNIDVGSAVLPFPARGSHVFLPCTDLRHPELVETAGEEIGIWLARAKSGASLIIPFGVAVRRNGQSVIGLVVLHHGETVEFAGRSVVFSEVERIVLAGGDRLLGRRCLQCRSVFAEGDVALRCPFCEEPYCADCWEYLTGKRCFSRNCNFVPVPVEGGTVG